MTEQTVLEVLPETESVCTSCKHFTELEGGFFCKLLGAFLSDQTLYIPCDFKENIE
jgi:hypothetical protein